MDILFCCSDLHGGSTVALSPPTVELDDGGSYHASPAQLWLWENWQDAWGSWAPGLCKAYEPRTVALAVVGDCTDAFHHGTPQVASIQSGVHVRIAHRCLDQGPFKHLALDAAHIIRGTESHVGKSAEFEEGLARMMREEGKPIVPDPDTGQWTSWWRRIEINGRVVDLRHHGKMGMTPRTTASYQRMAAFDLWTQYQLAGDDPPHVAVRGHHHTYVDSGPDHRGVTRLVNLPAWQLTTAFGHRLAGRVHLSDIGIVALLFHRAGHVEVVPRLYKPSAPTVIR